MESPRAGDGFVLVEEEDATWCTDDEYEFVEATVVESHATPAHASVPVGGGHQAAFPTSGDEIVLSTAPQGAVAPTRSLSPPRARELPVGGGDQACPRPGQGITIVGCGEGYHAEAIAQPTASQGAAVPTRSLSPPPPAVHAQPVGGGDQVFPPTRFVEPARPFSLLGLPYDQANLWSGVADRVYCYSTRLSGDYEATEEDEDEDEDYDDNDYTFYEAFYNVADFGGRARHVKPSSGRRGRTKKATAMGRPRGEKRSSHIAGNV